MNVTKIFLENAERILLNARPNDKIVSAVELNECFVFQTTPKTVSDKMSSTMLRPLFAVSKINGRVRVFNPLFDSSKEYSSISKKDIVYY